jgi:Cu/Ag efflux protein CusF
MKKMLMAAISLLVVFSAAAVVHAAKGERLKFIEGDVVTIDVAAKAMTVKGRKAETVITIDEKTVVRAAREKKSLTDIKVGDRVMVKYSEADGKYFARSIEVKPVKADKKISEPAKPGVIPAKPGY